MNHLRKVIIKLLGLKLRSLKPGSYETTLREVKILKSGDASITLSQVKRRATK